MFRHNTANGVASIFPWRKVNGTERDRGDMDTDSVDRHGIPRCRHCGGPGDLTAPRLGFHLTAQYHAMSVAGKHMERVWGHWRRRYGLAGKNPETRTYRRHSVPCQQLRADAARLIEWFRILLRLGWVAGRGARTECDERPVRGDQPPDPETT